MLSVRPSRIASSAVSRAERTLLRRSPVGVDRVDVGQDQQQLGAEVARQHRGGEILVDDRVDSLPTERRMPIDRRAAAAAGDDERALLARAP